MGRQLDLRALDALAAHPVCAALAGAPAPPDVAVVGGSVRDRLLGRAHPDLDLCVAHDPEGVAMSLRDKLGGSWFVLDPVFGTVRFSAGKHVVDLALRHGETWEDDLRRRDLTINALGVVLLEGGKKIVPALRDPTGGLADLENGLIRTVGREVIAADPVRTLRVFRFGAALGFAVDPATRAWVAELAPLLRNVAVERSRDELFKLLAAPGCAPYLEGAADAGLLEVVVPDLEYARGSASIGHFDAFRHRLEAVRALDWLLSRESPLGPEDRKFLDKCLAARVRGGRTAGALARGALLLQGLPRPADHLAKDLRLSVDECRFVRRAVTGIALVHEMAPDPGGAGLYRLFRRTGPAAPVAAVLALADHLAARDLTVHDGDAGPLRAVTRVLAEARRPAVTARRAPLLRGDELMAALDIPAGPRVAELLQAIAEARADGLVSTPEEALDFARKFSRGPRP